MPIKPRIAEVSCSKIRFEDGDRIIVKSFCHLEPEQKRKLTKSLRAWAGAEIEVFIYCALDFDIQIHSRNSPKLLF